jgi:enoyl-CoA hydratase/carnithine racemase
MAVALSYAANPDRQLQMVKQLLTENMMEPDLMTAQRREMAMLTECWTTPEHKEAVAAFLAKRPPVFRPGA